MVHSVIFNTIIKVFKESFGSFIQEKIINEQDWERHLYCLFRDVFRDKIYSKYILLVEGKVSKFDGNNILWITPNTYKKNKSLVEEYFDTNFDNAGHLKIDLTKSKKPFNAKIKTFLNAEKERGYYVDLILYDKINQSRIFLIELKMKEKLDESVVQEDYYKLSRAALVRKTEAIYIAVGFDPLNQKVFWKPTDIKYNYNFNIDKISIGTNQNNKVEKFTRHKIEAILKATPKDLYENYMWATEAHWASEVMYQFSKVLPANWRCNSEIGNIFYSKRERLDLGLYYKDNLKYAIELKGHYEEGIPLEIKNRMAYDREIELDFIKKAKIFFESFSENKSIKKTISKFPKLDGMQFINSDFFDKIIEMYEQCKRLSRLARNGEIVKGYMVFIDHQDDLSIHKRKPNISEAEFLNNFKFRKQLIEKLLAPIIYECDFIYLYGLNIKGGKKNIFL